MWCGSLCAISYSIVCISMLKAPHFYHWVSHFISFLCSYSFVVLYFPLSNTSKVLFTWLLYILKLESFYCCCFVHL